LTAEQSGAEKVAECEMVHTSSKRKLCRLALGEDQDGGQRCPAMWLFVISVKRVG
jgi:hypothetical protein